MGAPCLVLVLICITECSFLFCNHRGWEDREHDSLPSLSSYGECLIVVLPDHTRLLFMSSVLIA